MHLEKWDEDIEWFLLECAKERRPVPSLNARDAFADKVAMKLSTCVYPGEPVLNARKEAYHEYKTGRLHGCRW